MKRITILTGILVILGVFFIPFLPAEQKDPNIAGPVFSAIELRISIIEERLDAFEQRLDQLENPRRRSVSNIPAESDKDALRIERLNKQIQEARDAIELIEKQIEALPSPIKLELEDNLKIATEKWQLLAEQELNFLKIIRLAEKCPALGIDVITAKKDLIECQGLKRETGLKRDQLWEQIQNKKIINTVPEKKPYRNIVPSKK
jgi:DNA repair exonuclease SbcCD ATPase subunit